MIPCDMVLLFRSQEKKSKCLQLKQLDLTLRKHFLNRLSVNSTARCEWGPKIVQHNFILIFKYLCFKQYMITQILSRTLSV